MKTLFVVWQEPESRRWIPVGRLTGESGKYTFVYTEGARSSSAFVPFGRMNDLSEKYVSDELFPLFANRLVPRSRSDFRRFITWAGLDYQHASDLEILARTGGRRATDSLELFPCPEKTLDGRYVVYFFVHGIRHLRESDQMSLKDVSSDQELFLMRDVQNRADPYAICMRTGDPITVCGYVPRYYARDFSRLLEESQVKRVKVTVEQVNLDAPSQYRLLCRFEAPWPDDFAAFSAAEFRPLVRSKTEAGLPLT